MMVLNMNSKRIRRPNVRLWEIGDCSAAFACGVSHKCKDSLRLEKWMYEPCFDQELERINGQRKVEYSSPDHDSSPRMMMEDGLCNRENKDPNAFKAVTEDSGLRKVVKSKASFDFGTVTRKPRLMNRRRRSLNCTSSVYGGHRSAESGPGRDRKDDKRYERDNGFSSSNASFLNISDDETPYMSRAASKFQISDPEFLAEMAWNSHQFRGKPNNHTANAAFPQSTNGLDKIATRQGGDVNCIQGWLEELGCGKFALLFEIHEVDEEALPLLTFEDLKEMGITAIGPRRKLFAAIQRWRDAK